MNLNRAPGAKAQFLRFRRKKLEAGSFLLVVFLLLFSGGFVRLRSQPVREEDPPPVQEAALSEPPPAAVPAENLPPPLALFPSERRPGEPITVAFRPEASNNDYKEPLRAVLIDEQGRRLARASFFSLDDGEKPILTAILAVPCTALPGQALLRVESGETVIDEAAFIITDRDFVSEEIALNQENTDIRTVPDPRKTAESEQLWAIISHTGAEIYTTGTFVPPVASTRRTSFYGDRRVYLYTNGAADTAIHAGVDYGVPRGTAVTACADGRVVLARFRVATGNSVIIEHLPGVYSIYYHMDRIEVAEGAMVRQRDLLGESGSTGLSTGPHLHWEIRAAGENADPDAFTARPILDKEIIFSKLY
jgi:murein DD-endopeptidase MepM/ murein hydrolase activator NlpD